MSIHRVLSWLLLAGVSLAMTGCGVGAGDEAGELERDFGLSVDPPYVAVDIEARTIVPLAEKPEDIQSNPRWKTSAILFRRVPAVADLTVGLNAASYQGMMDAADAADENGRFSTSSGSPISLPVFYMAVFELTRGQWKRLAGSEPWQGNAAPGGTVVFTAAQVGSMTDETLPACGMTFDQITTMLGAQQDWVRLELPSRNQWEYGSHRQGMTLPFPWGDRTEYSTVRPHAWVQTDDGKAPSAGVLPDGPSQVGGNRMANLFDLWDMIGNIAEFTSDRDGATGQPLVCGGSWADVVRTARASNAIPMAADIPHPLVGLRLVVKP